jgi:hypothetical protein
MTNQRRKNHPRDEHLDALAAEGSRRMQANVRAFKRSNGLAPSELPDTPSDKLPARAAAEPRPSQSKKRSAAKPPTEPQELEAPRADITGKEPVPWDSGKALDMATFEREVRGVFSQWREVVYPDEETEPSLVRAVETYEAARRRVE